MDGKHTPGKVFIFSFFAYLKLIFCYFFQFSNKKIQLSEPLRRNKSTKLHLCAPWPMNADGNIYGIDIFEFDSETNEWHRRMFIEFTEENGKFGFGCVFVDNKLVVIGGERWLEVNGRFRYDAFDDVRKRPEFVLRKCDKCSR